MEPSTISSEKFIQELEEMDRPVLEAATMPPEAYHSQELYDREVEKIFMKEWLCVGRVEDVPNPGDFFRDELVGESIIVVRDADGEIHTHLNVCRHRGCTLVSEEKGNAKTFRCPYHGWMYALGGELRGVPDFKYNKNFDKADYPLHGVKTEIWEGMIMINFDHDAQPYADQVSETTKYGLDKYGLSGQVTTHTWRYDLACNWKVYAENYIEEYHVPWVHADTFQPVAPMKGWKEFVDLSEQPWIVMVGQFPGLSMSDSGEPEFTVAPATRDLDPEFDGMPIALMYPNFGILNAVDSTLVYMMNPVGPDRLDLRIRLLLHREDAEAYFAGDPAAVEKAGAYARNTEAFVDEDNKIALQQQIGLHSRLAAPGRFSVHEGLAHMFDVWVAEHAYGLKRNGTANGNGRAS